MNISEKTFLIRAVYIILITVLTAFLIAFCVISNSEGSYPYESQVNEGSSPSSADEMLATVEIPEDAYEVVTVSFTGSCTTGSVMGSSSYGTFNDELETNGAKYFLEAVSRIFLSDDLTVSGCNAVLSDRELEPAEGLTVESYLAPAQTAKVFSLSGIDALSLEYSRTEGYGEDGYADTKAAIESEEITWGDHGKAVYLSKAGISAAVYCRELSGEGDKTSLVAWLENASAKNDFVALYLTVPDEGSYIPDEERKSLFRSLIDAGADLVVGTDSARIQPYERYGGGYIVYSLGSLIDGSSRYPDPYTLILTAELHVIDGDVTDVMYKMTPCRTYTDEKPWHPVILTPGTEFESVRDFMKGSRISPHGN